MGLKKYHDTKMKQLQQNARVKERAQVISNSLVCFVEYDLYAQ